MKRFTDAIRTAVENKNWYGALMIALTMPDICGKLENPKLNSKTRSIKWFKTWMESVYIVTGYDRKRTLFLCGDDFYSLRCSLLHQGEDNIEEQKARKILNKFHFITPPSGNSVIHRNYNSTKQILQLQVDKFCYEIIRAVNQWSIHMSDKPEVQKRINSLMVIHDSSNGVLLY